MKKPKTTTAGKKATEITFKNLRSNKNYYIRIRTYKTVNGKRYYSEWSKIKKVKVK